jgi:hypothetical protein
MTATALAVRRVAAPRTTAILAGLLALGVLVEAALAGGFLGGSHTWKSWHENLGTFLILIPLASLLVGLALYRRRPENVSMLANRVVLLLLVVTVVVTGNAGGSLLAVHIPAAVAMVGLVVRQAMIAAQARDAER